MPSFVTSKKVAARNSHSIATAGMSWQNQPPLIRQVLRGPALQPKLTIGAPDDVYERDADRVADQVMRMSDAEVRTSPAPPTPQRLYSECRDDLLTKRAGDASSPAAPVPPIVHEVLHAPGNGLDRETRAFFEPRFGREFGDVRIHTDAEAAESARAVHALAYTVGRDMVFGPGRYAPETDRGRRLLAHELTHVAQQTGTPAADLTVRRACGRQAIGPTPADCHLESQPLGERRYLFNIDCDTFAPGEELRLQNDLAILPPGTTVSILGAASSDGDAGFNEALSCARARAAEAAVRSAPSTPTITSVKAVGPQGPGGDLTFRAAALEFVYPSPVSPPPPAPGPGYRRDQGFYLPILPNDPVGAFAACQAIPPIAAAICGTAVTGLTCPAWFCRPFPTVAIARECRDKCSPVLLAGITAVVRDLRVAPYWAVFLRGGASNQIDMSATFGADFASHPISGGAATYLSLNLETYLRSAAPTLFVGPGPWTIDFSSVLTTEIANLEITGHPQVMDFVPASTIAGLLAGGVGLTQSSCAAGLVPSAFDDHRRATVSAAVHRTPGGFLVTPQIDFRIEDTIDFCPGNCGTGAALLATVLLSRLEASGVSGDVPFLVDYTIHTPPLTV